MKTENKRRNATIAVECKKMLSQKSLYVCAILFAVIYLISIPYADFGVINMLEGVIWGGTFRHLGTICMVLPYGLSFYKEKSSGNLPLILQRSGKKKYCIAKTIACFLSGGFVATIGLLIYLLFLYFVMGAPLQMNSDYEQSPYLAANLLHTGKITEYFLLRFLTHFLYGGTTAILGVLGSMLLSNPFVASICPYLFLYVLQILGGSRIPLELQIECVANGDIRILNFGFGILYTFVFFGIYVLIEYLIMQKLIKREGEKTE